MTDLPERVDRLIAPEAGTALALVLITVVMTITMLWNATCFEQGWCHVVKCQGLFGSPTTCYEYRLGGWRE